MILMLILISGCALGSARDANRTWCETNHPRFFSAEEWQGLSRREKERWLAHNEFGEAKCGKAWANPDA